jgi:hypothetical protein
MKGKIIFISVSIMTLVLISYLEMTEIVDSNCRDHDYSISLIIGKYIVYLISRFYLLSLWNLEILGRLPYQSKLRNSEQTFKLRQNMEIYLATSVPGDERQPAI